MKRSRSSTKTPLADRRGSLRLSVSAPVEITNRERRDPSTEKTIIEDVGDYGCRFSMRGAVQIGDTIAIQLLAEDRITPLDVPAKLFRVVWVKRDVEKSTVGAQYSERQK